ncbi:hypothetical protein AN619_18540 [Thermotalea metallivorans]|uniref:Uncharacterized protein n=1 Tax=Thermotalea metallivorans TaxID=520762 RepID=A0A140L414_9FIRM|nr:hypothetical protein AN619_18540 [Thermotalea metallivorans]
MIFKKYKLIFFIMAVFLIGLFLYMNRPISHVPA